MSFNVTHAIVLVGGRGTRLQPLTDTRPKPMLPIVDEPFLRHQLAHLKRHGITHVTFACGFLPSAIVSHFGDGEDLDMELAYMIEPEPLDTAGAIAFAAGNVREERMLVCNGDILSDLDIGELIDFHRDRKAVATIALTPVENPSRYGLVRTTDGGAVTAFVEKPPPDECDTNLINAGTYVIEARVIDRIPTAVRCNIEREIFPELVGQGLYAKGDTTYWNDIGTFPSYRRATFDMLNGRVQGSLGAPKPGTLASIRIDPDAVIDDGVSLDGPLYVGPNVRIESGAKIGPDCSILQGAHVGSGARVRRSIVMEGAHVGANAQVVDSIVGEHARVGDNVSATDGAVIAPNSTETHLVVRGSE